MKVKIFILIGCLAATALGMGIQHLLERKETKDPVPGSCTIFSASVGENVLFGNNEDYYVPKTYLWTEPGTEENYGCLYLGFKDYAHQGGINEKGLCFDANALPKSRINPHPELFSPPRYNPPYEEHMIWAPVLILRKASTVEEAIGIAQQYQRGNWYPDAGAVAYQLNFADATGDAVVISVDETGELAFSRKEPGEVYLISTNYNKANPKNALEYPCQRYQIAEEMLKDLSEEKELSIDLFKSILDSVHQEGIFSTTLYSNIFDLKNRLIYLYHWHQFDERVVLSVDEELAKGNSLVRIKDLFSKKTVNKASKEYMGLILFRCISILLGTVTVIAGIHFLKKSLAKPSSSKKG